MDEKLTEEEQGIIKTFMMGSTISKQEIAKINEDKSGNCDYCKEENISIEHIPWTCKFFDKDREEIDATLAKVPTKYLTQCIQCGVAPALKLEGKRTYWGKDVEEGEDSKVKKLLGVDRSLETPGTDAVKTMYNEKAVEILEEPRRGHKNARKTMMMHKQSHGSGVDLEFPTEEEIEEAMKDLPKDYYVPTFGDGSHTTPKTGWASLGGSGAWIPE